jgi:hypothetical protein
VLAKKVLTFGSLSRSDTLGQLPLSLLVFDSQPCVGLICPPLVNWNAFSLESFEVWPAELPPWHHRDSVACICYRSNQNETRCTYRVHWRDRYRQQLAFLCSSVDSTSPFSYSVLVSPFSVSPLLDSM